MFDYKYEIKNTICFAKASPKVQPINLDGGGRRGQHKMDNSSRTSRTLAENITRQHVYLHKSVLGRLYNSPPLPVLYLYHSIICVHFSITKIGGEFCIRYYRYYVYTFYLDATDHI